MKQVLPMQKKLQMNRKYHQLIIAKTCITRVNKKVLMKEYHDNMFNRFLNLWTISRVVGPRVHGNSQSSVSTSFLRLCWFIVWLRLKFISNQSTSRMTENLRILDCFRHFKRESGTPCILPITRSLKRVIIWRSSFFIKPNLTLYEAN